MIHEAGPIRLNQEQTSLQGHSDNMDNFITLSPHLSSKEGSSKEAKAVRSGSARGARDRANHPLGTPHGSRCGSSGLAWRANRSACALCSTWMGVGMVCVGELQTCGVLPALPGVPLFF